MIALIHAHLTANDEDPADHSRIEDIFPFVDANKLDVMNCIRKGASCFLMFFLIRFARLINVIAFYMHNKQLKCAKKQQSFDVSKENWPTGGLFKSILH